MRDVLIKSFVIQPNLYSMGEETWVKEPGRLNGLFDVYSLCLKSGILRWKLRKSEGQREKVNTKSHILLLLLSKISFTNESKSPIKCKIN